METILNLENVDVSFGSGPDKAEILTNVNLSVEKNDFVAIVGFSGSGKTTLINLMAGLLEPTSGSVTCRDKVITGPGTDRGVVFQNYSLLPWLTVAGNVGMAVNRRYPEKSKTERRELVEKYVKMVNLLPAINKRPCELSGGMRQRVSVARALSMNPEILLLDEPLSALDALTRAVLQDQIIELWEQDKKTVVLITNDVDEGLIMANRIIPLTPGPNATLGPVFEVDLPRPRDRKALNQNAAFKRIRNDVMRYLHQQKAATQQSTSQKQFVLPALEPRDLRVVI